uniref:Uncharacterized protein n=1 Tax=Siphoviridae sp. ctPJ52 TaxID=2825483 RepID=A0A8S5US65_9CAUD|nr:MAG TPA: hypothetical protein [Siphoviridae sp. ctPJ52]
MRCGFLCGKGYRDRYDYSIMYGIINSCWFDDISCLPITQMVRRYQWH